MRKKNSVSILFDFMMSNKDKMFFSVIFSVIGELIGLIPYYAISKIVFEFYRDNLAYDLLISWIAITLLSYLFKYLFTWKSTLLSHGIAFSVLKDIRKSLTKKMFNIPMGEIICRTTGQWKNIIVDHVSKLEDSLAHIIPEMISSIVAPMVAITYMFILNWKMGLVSLISIPFGLLFYIGIIPGYKGKMDKHVKASIQMNGNLVEYISGIEVIKTFSKSEESYEKFENSIRFYHDTTMEWWKSAWFYNAAAKSLMPSTLLFLLPYATYLLTINEIGLETFIICLLLPLGFVGPLLKISKFLDEFGFIKGSLDQLMILFNIEEMPAGEIFVDFEDGGFELDNVSFSYEDNLVLKNVSFKANKGEVTAIVGPSGSGKSTIAKLMAGFWRPKSGSIMYGRNDLHDLIRDNFVSQISYVDQENFLFNTNILENIKIAKSDATIEEVNEACEISNLSCFIDKSEEGYFTNVGDGGVLISGGERQRVALARSILKNSPTIILDEATAHADPETDYLIQESINKMVKGKTMVVVAHRLGTIVKADKIVVVNNGRIEAIGRHEDLINSCSLYSCMWEEYSSSNRGDEID